MVNIFNAISEGRKGIMIFLGGVLAGTAGVSILASEDAKKVYVQGTAAALRCKEEVMTTATTLRENCDDIYAQAQEINENRAAAKASAEDIIEDAAE